MSILHKILFSYWYFREPPWETGQTPPEVQEFIDKNQPGKALDLGCGTGTNAITLAKNGWQVIGIDFVGKAIRDARQKARQAMVEVDFRVADVTRLSGIDEMFDFILDVGCYHNLNPKEMEAYRLNVDRLLEHGGTYMLYAFCNNRSSNSGSGVVASDLDAFSPPLTLISRSDGCDSGSRPSTWLTFQKDRR